MLGLITTNKNVTWGSLPVVVFLGDDVQLPPVCDSPVYKQNNTTPAAIHGTLIWQEFNTAVTLTTLVRQSDQEIQLRNVLNALRKYEVSPQQAKWLQKFQWNSLKSEFGPDLLWRMKQYGLCVFPTHQGETAYNFKKLSEFNQSTPVAHITATYEGIHTKIPCDKAGGLLHELMLCKGAKVMLTSNLNVKFGLFNGSMGTVIDIIYSHGKKPAEVLPDVVMVDFPKYNGPSFIPDAPTVVPIIPVTRIMDCPCKHCKRQQIPLRLAWATTIHKCQGMTIGKNETTRYIVINPGPT